MIKENTDEYLRYLSTLSDVGCNKFNIKQKEFTDNKHFCKNCPEVCDFRNTHLYGCYESQIYGGKYEYYCPIGATFIAISQEEDFSHGEVGIIIGPFSIENYELSQLSNRIPSITIEKMEALSMLAVKIFAPLKIHSDSFDTQGSMIILNEIYKSAEKRISNSRDFFEIQNQLNDVIKQQDPDLLRDFFGQFTAWIYTNYKDNIEIAKNRILEIIVFLSQIAVDRGIDAEQIFLINADYFKKMNNFNSIEDMSRCIEKTFDRFINYIFNFSKIKHTDIIYKIITYIKENYSQDISLDDLSDHVYMSKSYISKIFREEMQCSITDYINKIRIMKSKSFLMDRSLSIDDIAAMTGFTDKSYFTKVFKKIIGISPGKYRTSHLKNV